MSQTMTAEAQTLLDRAKERARGSFEMEIWPMLTDEMEHIRKLCWQMYWLGYMKGYGGV